MILSNFLSQQRNDDHDPSEIIPISFNAYNIWKRTGRLMYILNFHAKMRTTS